MTYLTLPDPYNLRSTMRLLTMGGRDPSMILTHDSAALCYETPTGAVEICASHSKERLEINLHGEGSEWIEPRLAALFGLEDRPGDFQPEGRAGKLISEFAGTCLTKTPRVFPRLTQIVLQQLVSWDDAATAWERMTTQFGEQSPGPSDLMLAPTPERLKSVGYYDLVNCGVLPRQARLVQRLAVEASRIERLAVKDVRLLEKFLLGIPGIGKWTVEYLKGTALGDPDAELTGDYSLPHSVAWYFHRRERSNDQEMLETLEPFRPHRFRIAQLLLQSGVTAPRRGPKMARNRWRFR